MGRKPGLSIAEQVTIDVLNQEGHSSRAIANQLGNGRSHTTVIYYLNAQNKIRSPRLGRKRKLSQRDDLHIGRAASNVAISSNKIRSELNLDVSARTVRRSLARNDHISFAKKRKTFRINGKNKVKRFEFSHARQTWTDEWNQVLFSDKKKLIWMDPIVGSTIGMI
jgi:transposase